MEVSNSKKIHVPAAYIAVIFSAIFISASFLILGLASQKYGPKTSNLTKALTSITFTKKNNQINSQNTIQQVQHVGQINQ